MMRLDTPLSDLSRHLVFENWHNRKEVVFSPRPLCIRRETPNLLGKVDEVAKHVGKDAKVGILGFYAALSAPLPRLSFHVQSCKRHLTRAPQAGRHSAWPYHGCEACLECLAFDWVFLFPLTMISE